MSKNRKHHKSISLEVADGGTMTPEEFENLLKLLSSWIMKDIETRQQAALGVAVSRTPASRRSGREDR